MLFYHAKYTVTQIVTSHKDSAAAGLIIHHQITNLT